MGKFSYAAEGNTEQSCTQSRKMRWEKHAHRTADGSASPFCVLLNGLSKAELAQHHSENGQATAK
jgi:hypothetical protein